MDGPQEGVLKRALQLIRSGIAVRADAHPEAPVLDRRGLTSLARHLVSGFEHQISLGCGNPHCGQTLCWTRRKATADRPLRPFTSTSVRALAYQLASRPDAGGLLCVSSSTDAPEGKGEVVNKFDPSSLVQNLFQPSRLLGLERDPQRSVTDESSSSDLSALSTISYEGTLALACIHTSLRLANGKLDGRYVLSYPFLKDIEHFTASCCTSIFSNPKNLVRCFHESCDDGADTVQLYTPLDLNQISEDDEWMTLITPRLAAMEFQEGHSIETKLHLGQQKIDAALRWWLTKCGDVVLNSIRATIQNLAGDLLSYTFEEKRWLIILAIHALNATEPYGDLDDMTEVEMGTGSPIEFYEAHQNKAALQLSRDIASLLVKIISLPVPDEDAPSCRPGFYPIFCAIMDYFEGDGGEMIEAANITPRDESLEPHLRRTSPSSPFVAEEQNLYVRSREIPEEGPPLLRQKSILKEVMEQNSAIKQYLSNMHANVPRIHEQYFSAWLIRGFRDAWDGGSSIKLPSALSDILMVLQLIDDYRGDLNYQTYSEVIFPVGPDAFELANTFIDPPPESWSLLYYPFCFADGIQIFNFRTLCLTRMIRAWYDSKLQDDFLYHIFRWNPSITGYNSLRSLVLRSAVCPQLTISVDRDNLVQSAFDQIWHRESKELLRSLKVKINHAGEEGQDQGGVAQEFFFLVFAEILSPDYGVFTIDEKTRMAWFDVKCLEPLYKIEMIGILMALAVHNGFTLPLTLPELFYHKIVQRGKPPASTDALLDSIRDGFPEQVRNLAALLKYTEEEMDSLAVDYVYSFDFYDKRGVIDMLKTRRPQDEDSDEESDDESNEESNEEPDEEGSDHGEGEGEGKNDGEAAEQSAAAQDGSNADDAPTKLQTWSLMGSINSAAEISAGASPVTVENRKAFIADYVHWLTSGSVHRQFVALTKGFHRVLPGDVLCTINAANLKTLVEGDTHISATALREVTRYEGYSSDTPLVAWFWALFEGYSSEQRALLLEFVTASRRIPATGYESIQFVVQRAGPDSERLPSSSTCFGHLLLPEYESRDKLEAKLAVALENVIGFGRM